MVTHNDAIKYMADRVITTRDGMIGKNYKFEMGKGVVLKEGTDVTIFATGLEVYESLLAAEMLEKDGISAEVVNMDDVNNLSKLMYLIIKEIDENFNFNPYE